MENKVKWGVIGAARIAIEKVVPAMNEGSCSEVVAIASRDIDRARSAAEKLGINRAYGSYEELLADSEVEAVYNPLPNHLHVRWTRKAAAAGKHVLCEKPIALNARGAQELIEVRDRTGVKIQEAFMVRTHPQWVSVRQIITSQRIGKIVAIQGAFSYSNRDPKNVRNIAEFGGGGLLDIGCYPITISRFVLSREPERVISILDYDSQWKVDRMASVILDFGDVQSSFVCGTQHVPYQRMHFFCTRGRVEVEIPFNAPPDRPCRILVDGGELFGSEIDTIAIPTCNQYTIQGDLFSQAIRGEIEQLIPLEDAVLNMSVIDAVFRSSESRQWEQPEIPASSP